MATSDTPYNPLTDPDVIKQENQPQSQQPQQTQPVAQPASTGTYSPLTDPDVQGNKPLSATYQQVMNSDASKNAQTLKLSAESGLPPGHVAQNQEAIRKAVESPTPDYLDNLHKTSPVTAQFASDPKNMAAIHDDIPANVKHESVFDDFSKGVNSAVASLLDKYVTGGPLEQGGIGPLSWDKDDIKALSQNFKDTANFIASPDLNPDAFDAFVHNHDTKPLVAQVVSNMPNIAIGSVGFILGRGAAAEQGFIEGAGDEYQKTGNPVTALAKGTVGGAVGFFTAGYFQKLYAPLAEKIGAQGAKEIISQSIEHFAKTNAAMISGGEVSRLSNAVIDSASGENPNALKEYVANTPKALAENAGQSLLMTLPGLGLTAIVHGPEALKEAKVSTPKPVEGAEPVKPEAPVTEPKATVALPPADEAVQQYHETQAENGKQLFLKALDSSKATKLSTDNPFQAKARDEALGKQYGAQTVHIPIDAFEQVFNQDEAPKMAEQMGDDFKKSYEQAKETGGTVSGPLSDLLNNKHDIKPNELADHIKFGDGPNDKTVTEAMEGRKVAEENQAEIESNKDKALKDFQDEVERGIKNVGGKAGEGSVTQAKGIAKVLGNMADVLKVPVEKLTQLYKFKIMKEAPKEDDFNALYNQADGMRTPDDWVKKYKAVLYEPRLEGETHEEWKARMRDAEGIIQVTDNPDHKTANTADEIAQHLYDAAQSGEITRESVPSEWFDGNGNGRPDAKKDDILNIIKNGGSGVETIKALNGSMQEHFQSGVDPYGLSKDDQQDIFGNVMKPRSKADEAFPDTFVKPNDQGTTQDMFPTAKGKKGEENAQQTLFQSHRGRTVITGLAGDPQGRSFNVYIGEGADQSTLFHEFAHNFLQIFRDHVGQEDATPEAKDIEKKMLDWFGVKDWSEVNDRHSEMFARGFEYRLWEGKSPTGLAKVFNKFAEWLRKIYPSSEVMNTYLKSVGASMTNEMRGVYDRFIASHEEIAKAQKTAGYDKTAPEGLSKEEFNEWKSRQDEAKQQAMDKLNTKKMLDLKADREEQISNERLEATKKAIEDVDKLPIFQAKKALVDLVSTFDGHTKELGEKYLKGEADDIEQSAIQTIANEHNFKTPGEFAYGLANEDYKQEVKDRVDDHMAEFMPKVHASDQEAQLALLHGDAGSEAISYESQILKRFINEAKGAELGHRMESSQGNKAVSSIEDSPEQKAFNDFKEKTEKALAKIKKVEPEESKEFNIIKTKLEKAMTQALEKHETDEKTISDLKQLVEKIGDFSPNDTKDLTSLLDKVDEIRKQVADENRAQAKKDQVAARIKASNILEDSTLKDARNVNKYMADFKDAAVKSKLAEKAKDYEKADDYKQKQLLNRELAKQAVKNRDYIRKASTSLRDMGKIEKKPLSMPFGHWFQIKNVLETFGMKEPKPLQDYTFNKIAKDMQDKGSSPEQIADATGVVFDPNGKPQRETLQQFKERIGDISQIADRNEPLAARINIPNQMDPKQMTLGDLRDIKNSLDAIYHNGKDEKEVEVDGKKADLDKKAAEFTKAITENVGTAHATDINAKSRKQKIFDILTHLDDYFMPDLNHIETVAELIDGAHMNADGKIEGGKEGPAHDLLTNPLRDAQTNERVIAKDMFNEQKELWNKHYTDDAAKKELEKEVHIKTSKGMETFTRNDARNITAISGTDTGLQRLMTGNKWTKDDLTLIKSLLKPEDVKYLQERAKLDEANQPKTVAIEMKVHGVEIKPVTKIPIETPYGTIDGMYHPLKYDYSKGLTSQKMREVKEDDIMERAKFIPLGYPDAGFTKGRAVKVTLPVRTDNGVYQQYLADTIHYLSHQEAVSDVNKALKHPEIQKGLSDAFGARGASLFALQTKYLATGGPSTNGMLEGLFHWSRITDILYHIGLRPKLFFVKRATDMINLSDEIGGVKNYIAMQQEGGGHMFSDKFKALMAEVNAKSPQMRDRGENFDYNARSIHQAFSTDEGALDFYRNNAYLPEKLADRGPAYLSWKYIESKALADGKDQKTASRLADAFVEQILGGGNPLQHIGMMRGSEFQKSFAPAFTFFSAQYQRMYLKGKLAQRAIQQGNPLIGQKIIVGAVTRFVIAPALIATAATAVIKHKKESVLERSKDFGKEVVSSAAGLIPGGRNVADQVINEGPSDKISLFPAEEIMSDVAKSMHGLYKGVTDHHKFNEKDAQQLIDSATEFSRAPKLLENETMNLYDDVMKNGPRDWITYLSGQRYKLTNQGRVKR